MTNNLIWLLKAINIWRNNGSRHFGTVDIIGIDILGIDILGMDILGTDILAPTLSNINPNDL